MTDAATPLPPGVRLRAAIAADLPVCATIWRDAINDYIVRLNQPEVPSGLGPIGRLHAHLLATDPGRFWVAVRDPGPEEGGDRVVAFGAATRRETVWFLSMLFVRPEEQGSGLGTALLRHLLAVDRGAAVRSTATDTLQPISNALYATHGMVPRMPLLGLVGVPERPEAFGDLPSGITVQSFDELAGGRPRPADSSGHGELTGAVNALDTATVGFIHPEDHRFLRLEGRRGFLFRGPDGRPVGYGYASESGRLGPVASLDPALVPAMLGHVVRSVPARGAYASWVPGLADRAVVALLEAGFRLDGFPMLVCWSRPFAAFDRYLPISPGLL